MGGFCLRRHHAPGSHPWRLRKPREYESCGGGPLVPYILRMTAPLLGRSLNRLEDERFVRGRGSYVDDLALRNALHGLVVRSPHAHARIAAVHVDAAAKMPGVAAVLPAL